MEAGLTDLSCEIITAQSAIDKLKRKRDDFEAAIWEEKRTMKAELDEERKRGTSSRFELQEKKIIARRERNDALRDLLAAQEKRKDLECMEKKAHNERDAAFLEAQKGRDAKVRALIHAQEKKRDAECMEKKAHDERDAAFLEAQKWRDAKVRALIHAQEKKRDAECMEKKAHDERDAALLEAQNMRIELECMQKKANDYRKKFAEEVAHGTELARMLKRGRETLEEVMAYATELRRMCKRDRKLLTEAVAQATELAHARQRSLEQLTKDKETLELAHQAEIELANRDRQNYDRELQHLENAKCKVEGELVTMQEGWDRLKIAHERNQKNLEEEIEKNLCQICLESPKDALCLPCLHAGYCFGCLEKAREKSRTCPTCRATLHGVLRTDICT